MVFTKNLLSMRTKRIALLKKKMEREREYVFVGVVVHEFGFKMVIFTELHEWSSSCFAI